MTVEDAELIKSWRMDDCTWRRIAELADDRWPDWDIVFSNQADGRRLCDEAMALLGEDYDDGWN